MLQLQRASLRVLAAGNEVSQTTAARQLEAFIENQQTKFCCALPMEEAGKIVDAPSSGDKYPSVGTHNGIQLAVAATLSAADFVETAGYDPPGAYQNADSFAMALSDLGAGFCQQLTPCC